MDIVNDLLQRPGVGDAQHEERRVPAEFRFIGSIKRVRGHTLFSYNTATGELKPATIKREVAVGLDNSPTYKTTAVQEKDCIYFQALNIANARKKLAKFMSE